VKADPDPTDPLSILAAIGSNVQDSTKFQMINTGNNTVALKMADGRYVYSEDIDYLFPSK